MSNAKMNGIFAVLIQMSDGKAYLVDLKANMQYNEKTESSNAIRPPS